MVDPVMRGGAEKRRREMEKLVKLCESEHSSVLGFIVDLVDYMKKTGANSIIRRLIQEDQRITPRTFGEILNGGRWAENIMYITRSRETTEAVRASREVVASAVEKPRTAVKPRTTEKAKTAVKERSVVQQRTVVKPKTAEKKGTVGKGRTADKQKREVKGKSAEAALGTSGQAKAEKVDAVKKGGQERKKLRDAPAVIEKLVPEREIRLSVRQKPGGMLPNPAYTANKVAPTLPEADTEGKSPIAGTSQQEPQIPSAPKKDINLMLAMQKELSESENSEIEEEEVEPMDYDEPVYQEEEQESVGSMETENELSESDEEEVVVKKRKEKVDYSTEDAYIEKKDMTFFCTFGGCVDGTKGFASRDSARRHVNARHTGTSSINCGDCDKRFRRSDDLRRHMNAVHTKEIRFQCPCGYSTYWPGNLAGHKKDCQVYLKKNKK